MTITYRGEKFSGYNKPKRTPKHAIKARHAKNIAKGKMSAAYWANKTKWQ